MTYYSWPWPNILIFDLPYLYLMCHTCCRLPVYVYLTYCTCAWPTIFVLDQLYFYSICYNNNTTVNLCSAKINWAALRCFTYVYILLYLTYCTCASFTVLIVTLHLGYLCFICVILWYLVFTCLLLFVLCYLLSFCAWHIILVHDLLYLT